MSLIQILSSRDYKRVLIIDDRGLVEHPAYNEFGFVDFVSSIDVDSADPGWYKATYGAVCVHGNTGARLAAWVQEHFPRHLRFVGEDPSPGRGYPIEVSRSRFNSRVHEFLRSFSESREPDYSIFLGGAASLGAGAVDHPGGAASSLATRTGLPPVSAGERRGVVRFDVGPVGPYSGASEGYVLPIRLSKGSVDFEATLQGISALEGVRSFELTQSYLSPGDDVGLDLLVYLRLSGFMGPFARCPISIETHEPLEELVARDPSYGVLRTPGVFVDAPVPDGEPPLTPAAYKHGVLDVLRTSAPDSKHAAANEWGAYRLSEGVRSILSLGGVVGSVDQWVPVPRRPFYWQVLSRASATKETWGLRRGQALAAWSRWRQFLEQKRTDLERPLRVLLVDDQAASGWAAALDNLMGRNDGLVDIIPVPPLGGVVSLDYALKRAKEVEWDVALVDLRLLPEDDTLGQAPGTAADLSGARLLRQVREVHPTRPIVVFTASSRSWSYKTVTELGADDYWVKEHPEFFPTDEGAVSRALDLAGAVTQAVQRRERIDVVWSLNEALERARGDDGYLSRLTWEYGPSKRGIPNKKAVRSLIDEVNTRSRHAYKLLEGVGFEDDGAPPDRFGQAVLDQSFLTLWSVVNVALELLVGRDKNGGYYFLNRSGAPELFWRCDGKQTVEAPLSPTLPSVLSARRLSPCGEELKTVGKLHLDTLGLVLWQTFESEEALDRFMRAKNLRNNLLLIHGMTRSTEMASLGDIEVMVRVIRDLFRL